jgi:hypothetical protein
MAAQVAAMVAAAETATAMREKAGWTEEAVA